MPDVGPNPYLRLRRQMFFALLATGLVPLLAMGVAGFVANRDSVEQRTRNGLEAMIKNRKVTVELFLEETLRQLDILAGATRIAELANPAVLAQLRDHARREHGALLDLGLIDDRGRHVAYVGPYDLSRVDYSGEPWFQQVMLHGRYESDVFLGFRRFPHIVMAVKKNEEGRDFILRATVDSDLLSALVREGGLESGADVFILNRSAEYQTSYLDEHKLMAKADIGPIPLHSGTRVVEIRRGSRRELVATAWLRGERWVLVARQGLPGLPVLAFAHPVVLVVFVFGLLLLPALAHLISRHRLRQVRSLESERAALYASVSQTQKMAAIGRMAASIAHEINNPLAIIHAQVGVLADQLDEASFAPAGEIKERIKKIEAQVERGRKVTHRLLGFSRRVGPDLEPVDVAAALDETIGFLEKEIEAQQIGIVRSYDRDVPFIRSNLAQMQQVFLNLVNNAVDSVDSVDRKGEIRLAVHARDGGVEVQVADNGSGISPADLKRLFEPFFSTKTGSKTHSGLGLSICQELLRGLGGRVSVESSEGIGTTFSLWFPLDAEAGGEESPLTIGSQ
jgi:two-component system NtrC family sensor kinase